MIFGFGSLKTTALLFVVLVLLVLLELPVLVDVLDGALISVGECVLIVVALVAVVVVVCERSGDKGAEGKEGGASFGGAERGLTIGGEDFSGCRCDANGDANGFWTCCALVVLMLGLALGLFF